MLNAQQVSIYKIQYSELQNIENKLNEKYVILPMKKFGSDYIVALFKYGVNFFVSDLNGVIYFGGIVK